jgi:hypothetical protein
LKRSRSVDDQAVDVCAMISPAGAHIEPAQPVCNGALLLVWSVIVLDHAFMIWMDLLA